jgi:mRNA interferase RelE/StbE
VGYIELFRQIQAKGYKGLKEFPLEDRQRIVAKIETMQDNLVGDVKKLTNFTPEYRLRVGDYRVLFEIERDCIVYRVKHRRDVYK